MPKSPRRERFRIHLSTAVVLMFVAGGIMWAQLPLYRGGLNGEYFTTDTEERHFTAISESEFMKLPNRDVLVGYADYRYGWPIPVIGNRMPVNMDRNGVVKPIRPPGKNDFAGEDVIGLAMIGVIDFLFALLALWTMYRLCEWRIRRRTEQNAVS